MQEPLRSFLPEGRDEPSHLAYRDAKPLGSLGRRQLPARRLLDEIDFGEREYLEVTFAGLPYRLRVRPDHVLEDFDRFVEFTGRYDADLSGVIRMDLRYENMIICALSDEEMERRAEAARERAKAEAATQEAKD